MLFFPGLWNPLSRRWWPGSSCGISCGGKGKEELVGMAPWPLAFPPRTVLPPEMLALALFSSCCSNYENPGWGLGHITPLPPSPLGLDLAPDRVRESESSSGLRAHPVSRSISQARGPKLADTATCPRPPSFLDTEPEPVFWFPPWHFSLVCKVLYRLQRSARDINIPSASGSGGQAFLSIL